MKYREIQEGEGEVQGKGRGRENTKKRTGRAKGKGNARGKGKHNFGGFNFHIILSEIVVSDTLIVGDPPPA